jgi:hypothetical protein
MARELKDIQLSEQPTEQTAQAQVPPGHLPITDIQQKEVVDIVIQDYNSAVDAREQREWGGNVGDELTWDEKYGALIRLYEDQKEARPEKWMANRSLRIAMAIVEMMFAKMFPAVWNEDQLKWKPVEYMDQVKVDRTNKFMKWAVTVQMKLQDVIKPAVKYCIKFGNAILKDKWEVIYKDKGEMQPKPILNELGQPIIDPATGQPQMTQEKVLSVTEKCAVELIKLDRFYIQPGQTDIQKEPVIHALDYYYHDLELMEKQGLVVNISNLVKDQIDSKLLSEMDQAMAEGERIAKTNVRRRMYPIEVLEWYGPYDADNDGFPEECIFLVDNTTKTYLGGRRLSDISKRCKRPFTKLGFMERECSFYWIGVLEQVKSLADELDACMNQLIDANTLSIMRWGFYDPTGDYEPETHVAKPRAMYPVRNPNASIYFPDMQIPIERLIAAIRLVLEFVERLTAASSYIMGKESEIVGGSGTATRTQAIVSAANERYAIPADYLKNGLSELLTNILCQYQMHIKPGLESRVLGENGEMIFRPGELYDQAIDGELDAFIQGSTSLGDRNVEMEISNWIYQNLMQNPLVMGSMDRIWKVTAKPLKAMGENPEFYLGKQPYTKQTDNPEDEHTLMRQGQEVHPEPQEQHLYHLLQHSQKFQDPEIQLWPEEAKALLQAHIAETQQMLMQVMQQVAQAQTMGGQAQPGAPNAQTQQEPGKGISTSGTPNPMQNQPQAQPNQEGGRTLGA